MVTIGPGETSEADAIVDLWMDLAAGQRDHGSHIQTTDNRTRIRESIIRHIVGETLLVARAGDGELAGFVMFTVESTGFEQDLQRGVIENLYVVPDVRNEGVGSALLDATHELLEARGVDAVALDVMASNEKARRFYRRHGYEPHRVEMERSVESDTHSKGGE